MKMYMQSLMLDMLRRPEVSARPTWSQLVDLGETFDRAAAASDVVWYAHGASYRSCGLKLRYTHEVVGCVRL